MLLANRVLPLRFKMERTFALRNFVAAPLRRALRWGGLLRKSSSRLAKKQCAASVLPAPCPPRRRRVRVQNGVLPMPRARSRVLQITTPVKDNRDPWRNTKAAGTTNKTPVTLTMSIVDLYQATSRALAKSCQTDISDADRAILKKLRYAATKHELIAGIRGVEREIQAIDIAKNCQQAEQREREAQRLISMDQRRVEEERLAEAKSRARKSKKHWSKLVKAALHGRKVKMSPPAMHIARWNWYEASWAMIQTGELNCLIPFTHLPWPTMNLDQLELEDYEAFILSPGRPRFDTLYWFERVEVERQRWDIGNVERKVIPLVGEDIRERVMKCAKTLLGYLELLVDKYTSCDE
ncbi:hypothetical protein V5O48_006969 [Marasmius crinis-equi]|uniref:Uncharacterized protein n=1 Tax=Marasmius crinis-equi TaxID=585013 RepID=A0ABR3FII2_9AGAR